MLMMMIIIIIIIIIIFYYIFVSDGLHVQFYFTDGL